MLIASAVTWFSSPLHRQQRNLRTALVLIVGALLLLVWGVFFSRLRWRVRFALLAIVSLVGGCAVLVVDFRGVTGDLLPVFGWRWERPRHAAANIPASPPGSLAPALAKGPAPDTGPARQLDWPQFLGPHRNATLPGLRLRPDWSSQPPRELWRRPVGAGWSGFAVSAKTGIAVSQEQAGEEELVVARRLESGQPLWRHADRARYFTALAGEGPRATPTIEGDYVYTMGAKGHLNCLTLREGTLVWTRNMFDDHGARMPEWGSSCSPLVWGQYAIVQPGGRPGKSVAAYRKVDGVPAWTAGDESAGYSSPVVGTLAGVEQVVMFTGGGIIGVDANGHLLWRHPWPGGHPHVSVPVFLGDNRFLISAGYGIGSEVVQVTRDSAASGSDAGQAHGSWRATRVWKSIRLKAKFTNVVPHKGHIYGLDDGILACLDAVTGDQKWKAGRYGHGQVILVGDLLLVTAENGEVALIEPVPEGLRELGRFTAFRSKAWNPPALADDLLLLRTDLEAACYSLPLAGPR